MGGCPAAAAGPEIPPLRDAELAELALAADPDESVAADAVCLWDLPGWDRGGLLPTWYMPAPVRGRTSSGWQRWVIGLIVASLLVINAYGLCSTYGSITFG